MSKGQKIPEPSRKWIGLAHVMPRPNNHSLGDAVGAYVPVVALAKDVQEFCERSREMLSSWDFDVVEIEDIEPVSRRARKYAELTEISRLADSISDETPVLLGAFQTYVSKPGEPGH